jgi:hypothetical protein
MTNHNHGNVFFFVVHVYQIDKLNSINYSTWSIKLQMLLIRSEIWRIVDRSDPNPRATNNALQVAWKLRHFNAQANIIFHCSDWQIHIISQLKLFKAMWDKFKAQYEHTDVASKVAIHKRLMQLTLSKTQAPIEFLEKMARTSR